MGLLSATADRRIPGVAADVDPYQSGVRSKSGVVYSVEENAQMQVKNETGELRYPSQTYETHLLWKEVFGED